MRLSVSLLSREGGTATCAAAINGYAGSPPVDTWVTESSVQLYANRSYLFRG